jgi:hypothetical protein
LIREAKGVLQSVVESRAPAARVVRSIAEESRLIMARQWPLVSLITNPGRFDDRENRTIRYPDAEAGIWKERYIRGRRILPVLLRCWAEGEDAADELFSLIIPAIPRRWNYDGLEGLIVVDREEHSDFVDNVNKLYLSVAEIEFSVPVATAETAVPTIKIVDTESGEINREE